MSANVINDYIAGAIGGRLFFSHFQTYFFVIENNAHLKEKQESIHVHQDKFSINKSVHRKLHFATCKYTLVKIGYAVEMIVPAILN